MFDELVKNTVQALAEKNRVVVAISGFGGSGKSHLTDKLRDRFKLKDAQIVRIDELYGPNPNGPDIFDQTDWGLLRRILDDVHKGKRLKFQGKGSNGTAVYVDEELPEVVLVEGIRLLQPNLMPSFDLSVWIDCPQDFAKQRAKDRDRSQGDDEETVARWDTDWGPKDRAYFELCRPYELATLIYTDYK